MESCSVGNGLNDECHKTSYSKVIRFTNDIINDDMKYVLSKRTHLPENGFVDICSCHTDKWITYYSDEQRSCCNPLGMHNVPFKKGKLFVISVNFAKVHNLIPGKKLCYKCKNSLMPKRDENAEIDEDSGRHIDIEEDSNDDWNHGADISTEALNKSLESLASEGLSPIKSGLSKTQLKRKL